MPEKRLVRRDPRTGKEVWCHFPSEGGFVFEEKTPVHRAPEEPVRLHGTQRHRQKIAEIPEPLYWELRRRFGDPKHNKKDWDRWLNDSDNRIFRTNSLRV
jgi:hypothetical protein